ncbi:MAG TPA: ferrochelatase [Actinomycetota bacterium]
MSGETAVLMMAYGTPRDLDDVEAYYTDIRGGRPPAPELLEELMGRYRAIGGRSPLLEITRAQAAGVAERLAVPTYIGMKHAPPRIPEAVERLAADGIGHAVGLVLAPHYSAMSVGDYERRAGLAAKDAGWAGTIEMIESWHLEPGYIALLGERVDHALRTLTKDVRRDTTVVFTAHSLPERILRTGDPYADQLRETGEAVAAQLGLDSWQIGWQSAGRTKDPWIGPDILEVIEELASAGRRGIVVCPCGFVSDHLEVLYDVDIECKRAAAALGVELERTASPNDDPAFIDVLATVVRKKLDGNE